jgi:hypothetical protein
MARERGAFTPELDARNPKSEIQNRKDVNRCGFGGQRKQ